MDYKPLRVILLTIGCTVSVMWLAETLAVGKGFISTYFAPFAFGPTIIASVMMVIELKRKKAAFELSRSSPQDPPLLPPV